MTWCRIWGWWRIACGCLLEIRVYSRDNENIHEQGITGAAGTGPSHINGQFYFPCSQSLPSCFEC